MAKAAYQVMFIRHGESQWNVDGIFTGWYNIGLTKDGIESAVLAGQDLKKRKYGFDLAFVSLLTRSIDTLNIVLKESGNDFVPVIKDWRLNERHYGDLQGREKKDILSKFGEEKFSKWRRSYSTRPPKIHKDNPTYKLIKSDPRYKNVKVPETECLADVVKRVSVFWQKTLTPEIKKGKKIIVSAHGNSIRAVVKYLENTSNEDIVKLNIPFGTPMVYELDKKLKPIRRYYVGERQRIKELEKAAAGMGEKHWWRLIFK